MKSLKEMNEEQLLDESVRCLDEWHSLMESYEKAKAQNDYDKARTAYLDACLVKERYNRAMWMLKCRAK